MYTYIFRALARRLIEWPSEGLGLMFKLYKVWPSIVLHHQISSKHTKFNCPKSIWIGIVSSKTRCSTGRRTINLPLSCLDGTMHALQYGSPNTGITIIPSRGELRRASARKRSPKSPVPATQILASWTRLRCPLWQMTCHSLVFTACALKSVRYCIQLLFINHGGLHSAGLNRVF